MANLNTTGKVAIIDGVRTPIGAIGGVLSSLSVKELGVTACSALLKRTGVNPALIEYVSLGWVMQDPRFPNLAKLVAEFSGIPATTPGTTFHENCASGAAAVHDVARRILLDEIEIGIAGGVESMSNVPRYCYQGRLKGQMYGDFTLEDGIMSGLKDAFVGPKGEVMGLLTERLVDKYKVTRQEQDEIALRSHLQALQAWENGSCDGHVVTIELPDKKKGPTLVKKDETPRTITLEELAAQRPYFKPDNGTITSLNSSSISDGAACLLLMSQNKATALGLKPIGYLHSFANIGVPRELMGEGAFKVIPKLTTKAKIALREIDCFELNEAFAAVVGAAFHDLPELERDKVNQWGSGIGLGHPVGCTGARQIVDMLHQLRRRNKHVGLTSRCVGGGMGSGEIVVV